MTQPARHIPRRRGYVLVVTLGLLVLSASLLVSVGRSAVRRTADAREAAEDLQRSWGAVSIRTAVLPHAEQILATAEQQRRGPVPSYRAVVDLGGQQFSIIVSDEQAKANVNLLLDGADVPRATNRLRSALAGHGISNAVALRPAPAPLKLSGRTAPDPAVTGFGQVFDALPPSRLLSSLPGQPSVADLLTCWGDGRINVRRAPEAAMRLRADPPLTVVEITRLLSARDAAFQGRTTTPIMPPGTTAGTSPPAAAQRGWLGRTLSQVVSQQHLGIAGALLADGSSCHSLWVISHHRGGGRRYSLTVLDATDPDRPQTHAFLW